MPSVIERAATGRAKCRACGQAIARGDERFGEALPSAYGEGESLFWFHLRCAACCRPESLVALLESTPANSSEQKPLLDLAREGVAEPRLCRILRAERASSGRARCRNCREAIALASFRIALHLFEEGRFAPIGTIHAACAVSYFGAEPALERLTLPNNELSREELDQVLAEMRAGVERPAAPGLAKTRAEDATPEADRKSSSRRSVT